jgi:hypothetical protein
VRTVFGDLSEEVRGQEAAEGRSGTLRGLEVFHTAAEVATRSAHEPDEECRLAAPDEGYTYVLELELEREARDESALTWTETRTLSVDGDGDMRLQMDARYVDALGNEGLHEPVRMLVGSRLYEGPDADHVYRRQAGDRVREGVMADGRGTWQSLLDSTPGWTREQPEARWKLGRERLRCDAEDSAAAGWLRRLATRGSVVEANLEVHPDHRVLAIRWLLQDGIVMKVHARDRVAAFDGDIRAPSDSQVIDVRRDRSWQRVQETLEELEKEGLIESGRGQRERQ